MRSGLRLALLLVAVTRLAAAAPTPPKQPSARVARLTDFGIRQGDRLVKRLTANDAHAQLVLQGGHRVTVGDLVGKGYFGAVYHLDAEARRHVAPEHAGPLVLKLAHAWRWSAGRVLRGWLGES